LSVEKLSADFPSLLDAIIVPIRFGKAWTFRAFPPYASVIGHRLAVIRLVRVAAVICHVTPEELFGYNGVGQ
jgi:hypothetical protein